MTKRTQLEERLYRASVISWAIIIPVSLAWLVLMAILIFNK